MAHIHDSENEKPVSAGQDAAVAEPQVVDSNWLANIDLTVSDWGEWTEYENRGLYMDYQDPNNPDSDVPIRARYNPKVTRLRVDRDREVVRLDFGDDAEHFEFLIGMAKLNWVTITHESKLYRVVGQPVREEGNANVCYLLINPRDI